MIAALAHAARVFERPDWLKVAKTAFAFVTSRMEKDGRLIHSWRAGQAKAPATASDYANMIWGALRLLRGHQRAASILPPRSAGPPCSIATTGSPTPAAMPSPPTTRPTSSCACAGAHDDATPNANAVMVSNLVALHLLTGKQAYLERAARHPAGLRRRPRPQRARPLRRAGRLLRPARAPARGGDRHRRSAEPSGAARARHVRACPCRAPSSRSSAPASRSASPALGRQDRHRRQAHRLRLPRPHVLAARHRARRFARPAAPQRTATLTPGAERNCARGATPGLDHGARRTRCWPTAATSLTVATFHGFRWSSRCRCLA